MWAGEHRLHSMWLMLRINVFATLSLYQLILYSTSTVQPWFNLVIDGSLGKGEIFWGIHSKKTRECCPFLEFWLHTGSKAFSKMHRSARSRMKRSGDLVSSYKCRAGFLKNIILTEEFLRLLLQPFAEHKARAVFFCFTKFCLEHPLRAHFRSEYLGSRCFRLAR
jgi:hypothetical protein